MGDDLDGDCKCHCKNSRQKRKPPANGQRTAAHKDVPLALFRHVHDRQYGGLHRLTAGDSAQEFSSRKLPELLQEKEYTSHLGNINKIFASKWLSDTQVVFGTKCNKLKVMDLSRRQCVHIPSLQSSADSQPADCPCGIHSIVINPSRTLLATGAENTNDVAVYSLPTFDPVCVGEFGHTDWIFDAAWLDDQFLVTGSRDNTMALWNVNDVEPTPYNNAALSTPDHGLIRPATVSICRKAEKVRAMAYNPNTQELLSLSLNAYLHLWDANRFIQKQTHKLVHTRENVCLAVSEAHNVYGVGSQSHVTLIDPRTLLQINHIVSKHRGSGVRSINFHDNMITIGTGGGSVLFYDLRANKYLEHNCGHVLDLKLGKGWLLQDDTYRDYFFNSEYPNAVYTHCLDRSGTKLFVGGGPLPAGLWGNYAGLWS